ncbi:MAG: Panacea domain-containing protein [Christensenellales bacterium]|jgi:uncharacterized phage-associated protein
MAKVWHVANFFITLGQQQADSEKGDQVSNLRLQKLLYFAQGCYLARHGKPLFDDELCAWKFGPVVPEVYEKYKRFENGGIPAAEEFTPEDLTPDEFALLLDVAREYDKYSTSKLISMTHQPGTPWAQTSQSQAIPIDIIKSHFDAMLPLASFEDALRKIEVITPGRDEEGYAVLPGSAEDWG